jgi:hypothetical protein
VNAHWFLSCRCRVIPYNVSRLLKLKPAVCVCVCVIRVFTVLKLYTVIVWAMTLCSVISDHGSSDVMFVYVIAFDDTYSYIEIDYE